MWLRSKGTYTENEFKVILISLVHLSFGIESGCVYDVCLDDLIRKISCEVGDLSERY